MSKKSVVAGVTWAECPHCARSFLGLVQLLRDGYALTCPTCEGAVTAGNLEAQDPALAKLLRVIREQDAMSGQPRSAAAMKPNPELLL